MISPLFSTKCIWLTRCFLTRVRKGPSFLTFRYMRIVFVQRFFEAACSLGIRWIDCYICQTTSNKWVSKVRLSLLTMTNPNQLCDVLLFVCSKMADETNLSSKLPIADRTREVWGRKLCWWCLSSAFPLCTFLLGFANSFASYSPAPLLMRPRHFVRSYAICSYDSVGILKSLREALRVSLYRFFWPPLERFSYLKFSIEDFLWQTFIRHSGNMACPS